MWRAIFVGVVICAGILTLSLQAVTDMPGDGRPGEAYTRVLGVTIDRVEIAPGADIPVERIEQGYLKTLAVAALAGAVIGGAGGWLMWRARRPAA